MKMGNQPIPADNSGPNFTFSGKVSPEFLKEVFEWAHQQAQEHGDGCNPADFEVNRDESEKEVTWGWGGEADDTITIQESQGKFSMHVSGDGEEIETPDNQYFSEAKYVDDQYDAYIILNGKGYDLDELLELLKQAKATEKTENSAATRSP